MWQWSKERKKECRKIQNTFSSSPALQQSAALLLLHLALVSRVHVGLHGVKQMCNFAGPTHESMDFCYLSVMFYCMFELFWKIYLLKNRKTSKKVGIQLRKTGILQTLWSSFPLEQVCCQCCFECSCCCVPTVRRNDETIVLRKCVISWCLAAALFLELHSSTSHT